MMNRHFIMVRWPGKRPLLGEQTIKTEVACIDHPILEIGDDTSFQRSLILFRRHAARPRFSNRGVRSRGITPPQVHLGAWFVCLPVTDKFFNCLLDLPTAEGFTW